MASENSQNRAAWSVAFGEAPLKGSRAMHQVLDFSLQNPIEINLTYETESGRLEFVQALYIDNGSNIAAITCTMRSTNQRIIIPAGSQAYVPVLASADNPDIVFTTTFTDGSAPLVPVDYLNFPVPAMTWSVTGGYIGGSTGADYSANRPANPPAGLTLVATAPVNATRSKITVQNQDANQIIVVRDNGANGAVSFVYLAPGLGLGQQGQSWDSNTFKGRVRVYGIGAAVQAAVFED